MSSELSQMILANGFDLKQNIKDQRNADSNEQLAQVLKQSQINQRDAQADYYNKQARGQSLQNTKLATDMSRGPQNTFKQVQGNDNNLYQVELNSQGNVVNSTLIPGMGTAPKKPLTALQEKMSLASGIDYGNMTQEQKTEAYKLVTGPKAPTKLQEIQLSNAQIKNNDLRNPAPKPNLQQTETLKANTKRLSQLGSDQGERSNNISIAKDFLDGFQNEGANSGTTRTVASFLPGVFTDQGEFDQKLDAFAEKAARASLKANGDVRPTDADVDGAKAALFGIGKDEPVNIELLENFISSQELLDDEFAALKGAAKDNSIGDFVYGGVGGWSIDP